MTTFAKDCDFSPYAQLVAALLPRAGGISVFEPNGELRWTSEDTIGPAAKKLVVASVAAAAGSTEAGESTLNSQGYPLYLFWLRDDSRELISVLAVSWRSNESEPKSFTYVYAMLRPVLECLRRELALRAQASAGVRPAAAEQDGGDADLHVLVTTSENGQQDGAGDGVRNLLQKVNHHMQCEFTALMVPERNFVAVVKADGREVDTSLLAKVHRQLMSLSQVHIAPSLLNAADSLPGVVLTQRVLSCPIRNATGRPAGVLALFRSREAPEFRRRHAMLADLLGRRAASIIDSSYDALTGLLTRAAFEQRARVQQALRAAGRSLQWTGLYIDVDRLHALNDSHGMDAGDKLLGRLGELIRAHLMLVPGALASRISGDCFAILLPTAEAEAARFAEALRVGVEALTGGHLGVTEAGFSASISSGVAATSEPRVDLLQAIAAAETACKAAKDRGRNCIELCQVGDGAMRPAETGNNEAAVRAMINSDRLRLHAQLFSPLPGSKAGPPHFELLLRVLESNGEMVGPGRFIAAAARHQLLPAVDRCVVQQAMQLLKPQAALLADRPVIFAINVSGQTLADEGFADFVIEQIRGSGIAPQVFSFEIAERDAVAHPAAAEAMMKRLRAAGCAIALDNFGTGLSSLAQLRALPVDMLKIDGSFVRDVLKDVRVESMVQTMAQLARSMNLVTVAGRVESEEIRQRVARLGVDHGQGFAVARPVPIADAIRDLPTYAAVARHRQGEAVELGAEEDTISAELQQQLLDASEVVTEQDEALVRMEKVLAGHDHGESALYQPKSR